MSSHIKPLAREQNAHFGCLWCGFLCPAQVSESLNCLFSSNVWSLCLLSFFMCEALCPTPGFIREVCSVTLQVQFYFNPFSYIFMQMAIQQIFLEHLLAGVCYPHSPRWTLRMWKEQLKGYVWCPVNLQNSAYIHLLLPKTSLDQANITAHLDNCFCLLLGLYIPTLCHN